MLAGLDEADAEDVKMRFDVLRSRVALFDSPDYLAFLQADSEAAVAAATFRSMIARARAWEGRLDTMDGIRALRSTLVPTLGPASVLAGAAHRYGVEQTEADRGGIAALYQAFCALVAATAVATAALGATVLRQKAELVRLAHRDSLTGLANRTRLASVLAERLAITDAYGNGLAVLCLDLDRFKAVNDQHGHAIGDGVLIAVAHRLTSLMGADDLLSRIGGDEFVVVTRAQGAMALAARIVDVLTLPISVEKNDLQIGTSVGVAFAPHDGLTAEKLMRAADAALYQAKRTEAGWLTASDEYGLRGRAA